MSDSYKVYASEEYVDQKISDAMDGGYYGKSPLIVKASVNYGDVDIDDRIEYCPATINVPVMEIYNAIASGRMVYADIYKYDNNEFVDSPESYVNRLPVTGWQEGEYDGIYFNNINFERADAWGAYRSSDGHISTMEISYQKLNIGKEGNEEYANYTRDFGKCECL